MASFSSRGPTGDWIKPDVTAPGVQVLAGKTPQPDQTTADNGPPGNLFMAIAGTSMSSPHSAGVSALVKAAHPTWTPEEIKSALMTSSVQAVVKEDGITPADAFDMGAGSIRADRAVNPTLVFDETYANFVAAGSDPLHRIDLNLASIDATTMTGQHLDDAHGDQRLRQEPDARRLRHAARRRDDHRRQRARPLHVAVGRLGHVPDHDQRSGRGERPVPGRINLVPRNGGNTVTMPVAFVKKQGAVTLTNTCSPLSFPVEDGLALTHCTVGAANFGSTAANVEPHRRAARAGQGLHLQERRRSGLGRRLGRRRQWSGTLTPAVPPQVTGLTDAPADRLTAATCALALLGVGPVAGVGDDTITNFNVPTFFYGGEPYTQDRRRLQRLYRDRRRHERATSCSRRSTSRTRPGRTTCWRRCGRDLNPAARPGPVRIATPHRWRQTRLDRRRLGRREELRQRDDALVRDLDPIQTGTTTGPRARGSRTRTARTDVPGDGPGLGTPARAIRTPA